MSKLKVSGNASGTGVITLEAPNTNTDRTITLPDGDISFGVGIDDNADATAITINASENVGIGTSSPTRTLHVNGNVQIDSQFALYDNVSNNIIEQSVDTLATNRSLTIGNGTYSDINIKLKSSGNLRLNSGSGGIQFNGDTAAANALDDYEQGTGTPTVTMTSSGSVTLGATPKYHYTKTGNIVHFQFEISTTAVSSPVGALSIGLPFASTSDRGYSAGTLRVYQETFTGSPFLGVSYSGTVATFNTSISGSGTGNITPTSGTRYYFGEITYRTDS